LNREVKGEEGEERGKVELARMKNRTAGGIGCISGSLLLRSSNHAFDSAATHSKDVFNKGVKGFY
jgi:hypothetical protein